MPFSSPSWRSLNPLKGSRNHPKKVTLNHQLFSTSISLSEFRKTRSCCGLRWFFVVGFFPYGQPLLAPQVSWPPLPLQKTGSNPASFFGGPFFFDHPQAESTTCHSNVSDEAITYPWQKKVETPRNPSVSPQPFGGSDGWVVGKKMGSLESFPQKVWKSGGWRPPPVKRPKRGRPFEALLFEESFEKQMYTGWKLLAGVLFWTWTLSFLVQNQNLSSKSLKKTLIKKHMVFKKHQQTKTKLCPHLFHVFFFWGGGANSPPKVVACFLPFDLWLLRLWASRVVQSRHPGPVFWSTHLAKVVWNDEWHQS